MEDHIPNVEEIDGKPSMTEHGIHVCSSYGHVFHMTFVETYRGLTFLQASRKLKKYYTQGPRKEILRFLKRKQIIQ